MWQLFIVTFFDLWEIQFDQVWSSLIHFGKNKTAIFILFKNVTTLYNNIYWYVQPLRSFFSDRQTDARKPHRHRSSNSSLDINCQNCWFIIQPVSLYHSWFPVKKHWILAICKYFLLPYAGQYNLWLKDLWI